MYDVIFLSKCVCVCLPIIYTTLRAIFLGICHSPYTMATHGYPSDHPPSSL